MPRRQQQIVAAQRPGGKWWPRRSAAECYQQSLRLLHPVISPESWTKLRTIYDQNENNKGDLQQWLHPKWSMWWWNYVDTELCILFLTFSIVSALRGPAMGWGLLLLCYSTLPQDSHPLCRSHGALCSGSSHHGAVTQNYRPGHFSKNVVRLIHLSLNYIGNKPESNRSPSGQEPAKWNIMNKMRYPVSEEMMCKGCPFCC